MPQLDTTFFLPQIFWILIGFVLVYAFIGSVAAPKTKKIMDERSNYVSTLDSRAQMLAVEAEKLAKESKFELQKARDEAMQSEAAYAIKLNQEGEIFKKNLHLRYAKKIDEKSKEAEKQSNKNFEEISANADEFISRAAQVILGKSHDL